MPAAPHEEPEHVLLRNCELHRRDCAQRRGRPDAAQVSRQGRVAARARPLRFGIQQLSEGVLWVSLRNDLVLLQTWATLIFSMFSHVVWPIIFLHFNGPMQACRPALARMRAGTEP